MASTMCMAGRLFAFDTHNVAHDREETENRPLSHRLHLRMIQHENLLRRGPISGRSCFDTTGAEKNAIP